MSEYVPPRHDVHAHSRVIPTPVEYFPAPQLVQFSAVARPWSPQLPAGHTAHCQKAITQLESHEKSQKFRLTTLAPLAAYRPLAHSAHTPDPFAVEIEPMAHARHTVAAGSSAKYPGPHCWHPVLLFLSL